MPLYYHPPANQTPLPDGYPPTIYCPPPVLVDPNPAITAVPAGYPTAPTTHGEGPAAPPGHSSGGYWSVTGYFPIPYGAYPATRYPSFYQHATPSATASGPTIIDPRNAALPSRDPLTNIATAEASALSQSVRSTAPQVIQVQVVNDPEEEEKDCACCFLDNEPHTSRTQCILHQPKSRRLSGHRLNSETIRMELEKLDAERKERDRQQSERIAAAQQQIRTEVRRELELEMERRRLAQEAARQKQERREQKKALLKAEIMKELHDAQNDRVEQGQQLAEERARLDQERLRLEVLAKAHDHAQARRISIEKAQFEEENKKIREATAQFYHDEAARIRAEAGAQARAEAESEYSRKLAESLQKQEQEKSRLELALLEAERARAEAAQKAREEADKVYQEMIAKEKARISAEERRKEEKLIDELLRQKELELLAQRTRAAEEEHRHAMTDLKVREELREKILQDIAKEQHEKYAKAKLEQNAMDNEAKKANEQAAKAEADRTDAQRRHIIREEIQKEMSMHNFSGATSTVVPVTFPPPPPPPPPSPPHMAAPVLATPQPASAYQYVYTTYTDAVPPTVKITKVTQPVTQDPQPAVTPPRPPPHRHSVGVRIDSEFDGSCHGCE